MIVDAGGNNFLSKKHRTCFLAASGVGIIYELVSHCFFTAFSSPY